MSHVRETTNTFFIMYLSPLRPNLVQAITPILFEIFDNIWLGHISGHVGVLHARRTALALFFFLVISPEGISKPNSCACHNHGLKCFDIVQVVSSVAEPLLHTYQ